MRRLASLLLVLLLLLPSAAAPAGATPTTSTPQPLPFAQPWTNTALVTTSDDWSGVPGFAGYRGDDLVTATGVDPQTVLADGTNTPVGVNANRSDPDTYTTGGVSEFELADPTIALNGSGHGGRLLGRAEEEARRRGARAAYLDTFSFQAPGFYEQRGYRVFGELEGFPAGHRRYFMAKQL